MTLFLLLLSPCLLFFAMHNWVGVFVNTRGFHHIFRATYGHFSTFARHWRFYYLVSVEL